MFPGGILMIRRINAAVILTLVFVFATSVFAQSLPVTGKVQLRKSDGTMVPLAGAVVQPFQTDAKGAAPSDKTDKKGQFSFAGLRVGATYVLSVSGPGAAPTYLPNVKPGNDNLSITLDEGDGQKFTEAEVRAAIAGGNRTAVAAQSSAEPSADQKKAAADRAKLEAEYAVKKTEVEGKNVIIQKALEDGNAAYEAKNYDAAIAKYDEGIAADPAFAGSAPVFLNNKGTALRERAVILYNQNVKTTDATAKLAAFKKVRQDFANAVDSFDNSLKVSKGAAAGDVPDPKIAEAAKMNALRGAKETFRLMAATEQVDDTKTPLAQLLIPEYIAVETDTAKKDEAKLILADVYRVAGDSQNAILAYRQVLEASPGNIDAMAGLGLSLVNLGYVNNDKTQLQEGANVLQKFASAAPDTNKYKADALGLIENLKNEQNVVPQKAAPARKRN